jgi:hypothetical protein
MTRAPLFNRRAGQSFEIEHFDPLAGPQGMALRFHITIGEYKDGKPGEVFITALGKAGRGSMLEAFARDAGVLISLAIQYGAPLETQRRAITRDAQNRPLTFVGAVLDAMEG